jgi:acid phosphatase
VGVSVDKGVRKAGMMKKFFFAVAGQLLLTLFLAGRVGAASKTWPANLPVYDHIVIVFEENKDFDQVIGAKIAPYINDTLCAEGASLTKSFGEEHNSEGNYFWLLAGSNFNIGFNDPTPNKKSNPDYPFMSPNLGEQLIRKGLTFKGYSESLPSIGDPVSSKGHYARKHVPWVSFGNIPMGTNASDSCHLRFSDFPVDFSTLPTVSFVIPNLIDDMHDGGFPKSIIAGDAWLKENLDGYYQWAKAHNSLLIITFDENNNTAGFHNLTDPASKTKSIENHIPTVFAGAHVKHGSFDEGTGVTHVNLLRTLEAMYKLNKCGAQQPNALKFGIADDTIITDVFVPAH